MKSLWFKVFKVGMTIFQLFYAIKLKTSKSLNFEASKDIMTKFKSQALHIIRIKYWKASGNGKNEIFFTFMHTTIHTFRRSWFKDDSTKWKGTIRLWSLKERDKCPMSRANWTFNPLGKIRSDQIWYIGMPRFATRLMFQVMYV